MRPAVVRVLPDIAAIDKEFDYSVPADWQADGRAERLRVGSMVRVPLHGRRVAGWITELDPVDATGRELLPLAKLSGVGPPAELIDLTVWAAHRWAGRRTTFLRAASPHRMVAGIPERRPGRDVPAGPHAVFGEAFELGAAVVRLPPADDPVPLALAACRRGDALIVVPDNAGARRLTIALKRAGVAVAVHPDDWRVAAGGSVVLGSRSAAWAPMPDLAAVLVFDEHDEALQDERSPTWHARDVVIERARRRSVPWVLASPTPSLEALRAGQLLRPARAAEWEGWPRVEVVDRRADDPTRGGPIAEAAVPRLRDGGRVVCVLNRTGRSRLLACATCGELVRSEDGRTPMVQLDNQLSTPDGSEARPLVCAHCGSTTLKNLRMGVTRAREEIEALAGEAVAEVTSATDSIPETRIVVGTEAVLHRIDRADTVIVIDLDQELLAPRQRAAEQALALLARAARLLGRRADGGRLVLQTRQPDHEVVQAAVHADPSIVAVAERDRRSALHLPPYGAQAEVSGAAADAFIERLGTPLRVEVRGPRDGRYLLRAGEHGPLLDALDSTERPEGRLRIAVDPLRV